MISEVGTVVKTISNVVDTAMKVKKTADGVANLNGLSDTSGGTELIDKIGNGAKNLVDRVKGEVDKLPIQMKDDTHTSKLPEELPFESESVNNQENGDKLSSFSKAHIQKEVSNLPGEMNFDNVDNSLKESSNEVELAKELTIEGKQEIANKTAQEYNARTNPYERAKAKGIEGVTQTENGGVSFAETDKIYVTEDENRCITKITATGNRLKDFNDANAAMGLDEVPDGYVWHHVDDYNVEDGTITLELVEDEAHNASKPHSGGCAQYDSVNGPSYNPPKRGEV